MLNDQVIKHRWPGLVSGKLSDVLGLFLVPFLGMVLLELLDVVRRRPRARQHSGRLLLCCALAATALVATKVSHGGGDAYGWLVGVLRWPFASLLPGLVSGEGPSPPRPVMVVRDPWDLVALVALPAAVLVCWRRWGGWGDPQGGAPAGRVA